MPLSFIYSFVLSLFWCKRLDWYYFISWPYNNRKDSPCIAATFPKEWGFQHVLLTDAVLFVTTVISLTKNEISNIQCNLLTSKKTEWVSRVATVTVICHFHTPIQLQFNLAVSCYKTMKQIKKHKTNSIITMSRLYRSPMVGFIEAHYADWIHEVCDRTYYE